MRGCWRIGRRKEEGQHADEHGRGLGYRVALALSTYLEVSDSINGTETERGDREYLTV